MRRNAIIATVTSAAALTAFGASTAGAAPAPSAARFGEAARPGCRSGAGRCGRDHFRRQLNHPAYNKPARTP